MEYTDHHSIAVGPGLPRSRPAEGPPGTAAVRP